MQASFTAACILRTDFLEFPLKQQRVHFVGFWVLLFVCLFIYLCFLMRQESWVGFRRGNSFDFTL